MSIITHSSFYLSYYAPISIILYLISFIMAEL